MNSSRKWYIQIIGAILFIGIMCSCDRNSVFQKMEKIEGETWNANDTVVIPFDVEDTISPHNFYLKLRNNKEYPYQNIHFFLEMEFPNGKKWMDTVECRLADAKGNWTGSGIGDVKAHSFLFLKGEPFPLKGEHRFRIVHGMRREELRGIEDVGLGIERIPKDER